MAPAPAPDSTRPPAGPPVHVSDPGQGDPILGTLTQTQREAVCHGAGPLLIVAGAGTGKTTVISRRIAWLVANRLARPSEILALTFTEKAAQEMEERVDRLVPYGYTDLDLGTFHSFGYRILREHALEAGLDPRVRVLSRAQQIIFLMEHLFELPLDLYRPLGNPTGYLEALLALMSRAKDEGVAPVRYLEHARVLADEAALAPDDEVMADLSRRQGELARTYEACQDLMTRHGFIDFGDQVFRVLELFRAHPSLLRGWQEKYRFILVDEFQDTNRGQCELVRMLAAGHGNLTVVGDDDQAIYRFRGAAVSNILEFLDHYPQARLVVLKQNFRSPQAVLDASYRLIRHNNPDRLEVRSRIDKRLVAEDAEGPLPFCQYFDLISSEADEVARLIADNVEAGRHSWSDHAILVRNRSDVDPFLRALNVRGIPYSYSGGGGLYGRPEVRMLIDFLRVVADLTDSLALFSLAASEAYHFETTDLAILAAMARRRHASLWDVFLALERQGEGRASPRRGGGVYVPEADDLARLGALSADSKATVSRLLLDVRHFVDMAARRPAGQVLYQFLRRSGLLERLSRQESSEDDARLQNIARFFDVVKSYEVLEERARVPQFVGHLALLVQAGDDPPVVEGEVVGEAVQVLTVHKSKGLEFPVVFIVEAVEGRFPTRKRGDALPLPVELTQHLPLSGDAHLQEERRLFYVAMTRARRSLHIFGAREGGTRRPRRLSPFVGEALDLPRLPTAPTVTAVREVIERLAEPPSPAGFDASAIPDDQVLTLSHLQVDDFLTCPLKYKYAHILRVPLMAHHSVVYGLAIHEGVSCGLRARQREADGGEAATVDEVLEAYACGWRNEGFLSVEHEARAYARGREVLEAWFLREQASARVPYLVEHPFSFWLDRNRIQGRFDRVDCWDGGAAIVDYKTSDVRSQDEADARARESLQLGIYALAWHAREGRVPDYVELHFLESGLSGKARKTLRDLESIRSILGEAAVRLRARDHAPRPRRGSCGSCAFSEVCPAAAQKIGRLGSPPRLEDGT